jgi:hypothetical protein
MAYMTQENKKSKTPQLRAVFKKYNVKASIAVRDHSSLVVNVKSSAIDFIGNYNKVSATLPDHRGHVMKDSIDVNTYWLDTHYTGQALAFLTEVLEVMNDGNYDKSDIQTDYHNVGWYNDINIGQWSKPYILTETI